MFLKYIEELMRIVLSIKVLAHSPFKQDSDLVHVSRIQIVKTSL